MTINKSSIYPRYNLTHGLKGFSVSKMRDRFHQPIYRWAREGENFAPLEGPASSKGRKPHEKQNNYGTKDIPKSPGYIGDAQWINPSYVPKKIKWPLWLNDGVLRNIN